MADWSLPTLTSTYTNVLNNLKDRDAEAATQAYGAAPTNPPTNFIRFVSANNRWERWDGTSWVVLSSAYALSLGTGSTIENTPIGATTQNTGGFSSVKIGTSYTDNTAAKLHVSNGNMDGTGGITVDSLSPTVALVDRSASAYSYRMRVDANSFRIEVDNGNGGAGWNTASFTLGRYGNILFGEGAEAEDVGLYVRQSKLVGTTQYGVYALPVFKPSLATNAVIGFRSAMSIANEAGTIANSYGMLIDQPTMGASGSITTASGLWVTDFSSASIDSAFAARLAVQAGANRWNLYSSGTAPNYMNGDLRIGTTTQSGTSKLTVSGTASVSDGTAADHAATKGQVEGYFSSRGLLTGSVLKTAAQLNVPTLVPGNYAANATESSAAGLPSSDHHITHVSYSTNFALQAAVSLYDPNLRYTRVCNAGTWTAWATSSAAPTGRQEFTSSGTFNVPAGVTAVYVSGIGGGGGAGGKNTSSVSTGGGGSGQYCIRKKLSVTPGQVIAVTIGAGGSGGTTSGTSGSSGGATTFGALLTLSGGSGSPGRTDTNTSPGIGGYPNGQTGGYNGTATHGGNGGCSPFGNGGVGVSGDGGSAAANTGGGGGGAGTTPSRAGGAGGSGYLLVEW